MHRPLFSLARILYRGVPFRSVRQLGYSLYASLVLNRVVLEDVDGAQY